MCFQRCFTDRSPGGDPRSAGLASQYLVLLYAAKYGQDACGLRNTIWRFVLYGTDVKGSIMPIPSGTNSRRRIGANWARVIVNSHNENWDVNGLKPWPGNISHMNSTFDHENGGLVWQVRSNLHLSCCFILNWVKQVWWNECWQCTGCPASSCIRNKTFRPNYKKVESFFPFCRFPFVLDPK